MAFKITNTSLSFLVMCMSQTIFAGEMGAKDVNRYVSGFYVGASIGASDLQDKISHTIVPETHHLGSIGIVGGGLVGYDFSVTQKIKMGIEGFGNAAGLNAAVQHYDIPSGIQSNSEEVSSRWNAGVRLLPGFQFTPDHEGHLIVGYAQAGFKHTDNGTYGYLDTNFNKSGIQGGAGWKTALLKQNVLLRLDVLYTKYANQSSTGQGLPGSGSLYQYYQDSFSTLEANLALIYKFS